MRSSGRIRYIQEAIATRAIELLSLNGGVSAYILDIGCGSGISGLALEEAGHIWVGVDISEAMLSKQARFGCVIDLIVG